MFLVFRQSDINNFFSAGGGLAKFWRLAAASRRLKGLLTAKCRVNDISLVRIVYRLHAILCDLSEREICIRMLRYKSARRPFRQPYNTARVNYSLRMKLLLLLCRLASTEDSPRMRARHLTTPSRRLMRSTSPRSSCVLANLIAPLLPSSISRSVRCKSLNWTDRDIQFSAIYVSLLLFPTGIKAYRPIVRTTTYNKWINFKYRLISIKCMPRSLYYDT